MKRTFILIVFVSFLAAGLAYAGGGETSAESSAPELDKVVVLCASDEKEKFEKAWGSYIADHDLKGDELQKTINEVSDRAELYRNRERILAEDATGHQEDDSAWKAERREFMSEVARRALNPAR